jgi:HlyD family secretion protein
VRLRVDKERPMRAQVSIVGRPQPLTGTITSISVLSDNQQRWWNPDLKEFPVDVVLDQTPFGLKPGTSCMVEIVIDQLRNVLTVPLASIYTQDEESYVFVSEGGRVRPQKVTIGQSNETHIEITEGITAGQTVLLLQVGQGRALLGDRGEKRPAPSTQKTDVVDPAELARSRPDSP